MLKEKILTGPSQKETQRKSGMKNNLAFEQRLFGQHRHLGALASAGHGAVPPKTERHRQQIGMHIAERRGSEQKA